MFKHLKDRVTYCIGNDGKKYAIKTYTSQKGELLPNREAVKEILYLKYLKHDNIVDIADIYFYDKINTQIIMPRYHTNLYSLKNIKENDIKIIVYNVTQGLKYLHDKNIVHRDIKPENILTNSDFSSVKICDFGFCKLLPHEDIENMNREGTSIQYTAPELLNNDYKYNYDKSIDIWSLGCTIWFLFFNKDLFNGNDSNSVLDMIYYILDPNGNNDNVKYTKRIKSSNILTDFETKRATLSQEWRDLLFWMITYHPLKRLTCDDILSHPFSALDEKGQEIKSETLSKSEKKVINFSKRSNNDIITCAWIVLVYIEWKLQFKTILSTIILYDYIRDKLKYNQQELIISCLSICADFYENDIITIGEYVDITDNSVKAETINIIRTFILSQIDPKSVIEIPDYFSPWSSQLGPFFADAEKGRNILYLTSYIYGDYHELGVKKLNDIVIHSLNVIKLDDVINNRLGFTDNIKINPEYCYIIKNWILSISDICRKADVFDYKKMYDQRLLKQLGIN